MTRSTPRASCPKSPKISKAVETKKYEIVKAKAEKLLQEKADQDKKIKKHALMPPKPHTKRVRQASRAS
ncbi:hypothetical protein CDC7B_1988 [Corynebacterium diphtheriae C7 (beta)]|nr:hypothetical protein CDC7B_1988 [Corynebacterium diphtheriae C7 (beta)]OMO45246.1 hypothetical protein BVL37_11940 [Corynebacterium diphtheriae]OMO47037.1 hypothetical protein BVL40_09585 [Corynebacterium diphtheriae]RKW83002.1 hypothetical protein D9B95_10310 [Corynebacterium diphtheriae]RKX05872.1 hypothetical protein D9B98_10175 [Corynebacterium diphtheriae]